MSKDQLKTIDPKTLDKATGGDLGGLPKLPQLPNPLDPFKPGGPKRPPCVVCGMG